MRRFEKGDQVRIDIPDQTDPDHDQLHGLQGTVVEVVKDDAGEETGDPRDSYIFSVETEDGSVAHLRWRDLRPTPD
jgi:ribosomal protein L21E